MLLILLVIGFSFLAMSFITLEGARDRIDYGIAGGFAILAATFFLTSVFVSF